MPLFAPTPGGGYAATGGYQQITPTGYCGPHAGAIHGRNNSKVKCPGKPASLVTCQSKCYQTVAFREDRGISSCRMDNEVFRKAGIEERKRLPEGPKGGERAKKVRRGGQGGFSDSVDAPTFFLDFRARHPDGDFRGLGERQRVGFRATSMPRRAGLRWTSLGATGRTPKRAAQSSPNSRTNLA